MSAIPQIRKMLPEESKEVKAIGARAFKGFEKLLISKPKEAMVAELDGKIVGAILYKIIKIKELKVGYVDFAFIDPSAQGKGAGKKLYKETIEHLYDIGCDYVSALVKDDNVTSWGLFLKHGINRISILGLFKEMGIYGGLKLIFATPFFVAVGMEYYLGSKNKKFNTNKQNTFWQILVYLIVNLVFFSIVAVRFENILHPIVAMIIILTGSIFAGFIGTIFSGQKWHFRFNDGGFLITLITGLSGGILPMIGNWYPNEYKKSLDFRRSLGIVGVFKWLSLIIISLTSFYFPNSTQLEEALDIISSNLLVFYCIPFYPFESFAGGRVWKWNKVLYFGMVIISIGVIFW